MIPAKTTLEQWAVLATVVDKGGFAQAARALHRSQSAVSYAVSRLQDSIGLPLLAIDGRKSVLTPHGKTLLGRARSLLHDVDTLESLARSLKQGWEPELKLVVDVAFPRARAEALSLLTPDALQIAKALPGLPRFFSDFVTFLTHRSNLAGFFFQDFTKAFAVSRSSNLLSRSKETVHRPLFSGMMRVPR